MSNDVDELIDRCLADLLAGKATLEMCVQSYPQYPQLADQLRIVYALRTTPIPRLSAADEIALRERILSQAAVRLRRSITTPRPSLLPQRGLRALVPAAIAFAIVFGALPALAQPTLPGEALYPVKRIVEQVRVTLASDTQRPEVRLELARIRLNEYEILSARGAAIAELLDEAAGEVDLLLDEMTEDAVAQSEPTLVAALQVIDRTDRLAAQLSGTNGRHLSSALDACRDQIKTLITTPITPTVTSTAVATATPMRTATTTTTPRSTLTPKSPSDTPTTSPAPHTPPGLVRPPQTPPGLVRPPQTPPGLVNTPKPPTQKPPKDIKEPKK